MRKFLTAAFAAIMTACMTPGVISAQDITMEQFQATKREAKRGNFKAQYNLGVFYFNGRRGVVAQNEGEGVRWWREAAAQGYANAQYALGGCYFLGHGVAQNKFEAFKWFRKAAAQGFANAQYSLGVCYANGEGVEQNEETAVEWLRKAARQGDKDARQLLSQSGLSW